ncbi:MAG TPA: hypothetical protein VE172_08900 [Stackebrandtia sp.]|jgi:uncharacterized protein YjeT (DUF2065 family)|uniref:hypothetical protein n=1 Tax=Stackebrandtia sp. TaxID=2023065 RepID=UPI002D2B985F|nr:hypothetical protein [Stackebrandtia sp.]HZE38914.1 hypothetical protein [Stackebrandtia sp.]
MPKRIRQIHRWLSMTFLVTVAAGFVVLFQGAKPDDPAFLVFYTPLPPLAVLVITGVYMFLLPYRAKRRAR